MDIRRLEAFKKVYELRSFSRAAQELFLSQPTISAHVSSLEEELGTRLFDRIGKTILPTKTGEMLHGYAEQVFALLRQARAEVDLLQHKVSGRLRIGGSTIPADHILPGLLADFTARHPEVTLDLKVGDSALILESLMSGSLDFGVVGARDERPELHFMPILQDELILIAPGQYKPSRLEELTPAKLRDMPWVFREKGSGTRQSIEEGLHRMGLEVKSLNILATVQSTGAVLSCVRAGLGISITSRLAAGELLEKNEIRSVPVAGLDLQRCFYAVYRTGRLMLPAVNAFITLVKVRCTALQGDDQWTR